MRFGIGCFGTVLRTQRTISKQLIPELIDNKNNSFGIDCSLDLKDSSIILHSGTV